MPRLESFPGDIRAELTEPADRGRVGTAEASGDSFADSAADAPTNHYEPRVGGPDLCPSRG